MKRTIVLGVSGGIAAYKAVDLASKLTQLGFAVPVIMTQHAQEFVTPTTFRAITKLPVATNLWDSPQAPVPHISLSDKADLVVVAPATANIIGKYAQGLADDMLSTTLLATKVPVIMVPSMNTAMWENPSVQANIALLKSRGVHFVEPDYGYLACGVVGKGRYPDNQLIIDKVYSCIGAGILSGKKVIITYGGTQEAIDPVRVLTNRSSGKMGLALISAAERQGAQVVAIKAETVAQLKQDILAHYADADILIMAAAVSDYRPIHAVEHKIKSDQERLVIELERNEDVLAFFGQQKKQQVLVGFALESENLLENARKKMTKKNLDMIIANDISALGADRSSVTIVTKAKQTAYTDLSKETLAEYIIDAICRNNS